MNHERELDAEHGFDRIAPGVRAVRREPLPDDAPAVDDGPRVRRGTSNTGDPGDPQPRPLTMVDVAVLRPHELQKLTRPPTATDFLRPPRFD